MVHQVHRHLDEGKDLLDAVRSTVSDLEGAYALGVASGEASDRLVAARWGSPLVIGMGTTGHYCASDVAALIPITQTFVFLEDGDVADLRRESVTICGESGMPVE